MLDPKRHHIRAPAKEEVPRTYLRDGSVKLLKGHPFASSISSLSREPNQGGADQGKPCEQNLSCPFPRCSLLN